jgi:hypothetical protein
VLEANKLFDEVLARRDRADATRNALGVLQRFKFLFSLPVSIERNIRKGDYDVVINDYARAKNLFSNTDVAVSVSSLFYFFSLFTFLRVNFVKSVQPFQLHLILPSLGVSVYFTYLSNYYLNVFLSKMSCVLSVSILCFSS